MENKDTKLVWSDESGDLRNAKNINIETFKEKDLLLLIRRKTSGKGRTIIEIKGLPHDKKWCKKLAKDLKKNVGVGGAYKDDYIEIHGEKLLEITELLSEKALKFKKVGG